MECPFFDGTTDYFYTKEKGDVKVIGFEWGTFKDSILGVSLKIEKDVGQKFIEKYDFLVGAVSELLGKPLAIEQKVDWRVDTKWRSANGINAYLYRFTHNNQVRLYLYRE